MPQPTRPVRAMVLAVQVFDEVDLTLSDDALVLPGGVRLAWPVVTEAVGRDRAVVPEHRARFVAWLRLVGLVAQPADLLALSLRPVGLPRDHALHPGRGWTREVVLGDALHLGPGLLVDDRVELVPPSVWRAAAVDPDTCWPRCRERLEEMGALAARRWALSTDAVLRPMGDCDVVTLLGSRTLRARLAGSDGGMRAVVVPMRTRGWTRLSLLDPVFGPAAAMATDPEDRGFVRPVLVTADEVVLAGDGGRTDIVLRDRVRERWDATFR